MTATDVLVSFYGISELNAQDLLHEMRYPQSVQDLAGRLTYLNAARVQKVSGVHEHTSDGGSGFPLVQAGPSVAPEFDCDGAAVPGMAGSLFSAAPERGR